MKKLVLTTAIALAFAISAQAQEAATAAPVVEVSAPVEILPAPQLQEDFAFICASNAQLSDKAKLACLNNALPKVAKATTSFRNTGIGAEFNTLIRNKVAFTATN